MGPTVAIPKALAKAGRSVGDIDLWEVNEAFCSVPIAAYRTLGIDPTILNVNGSGCSLGHPIAATGAMLIGTALDELERTGGRYGLVTMCAAGGMAPAVIIERV
jgi:acetyl-CoA C-acetyltransferase